MASYQDPISTLAPGMLKEKSRVFISAATTKKLLRRKLHYAKKDKQK